MCRRGPSAVVIIAYSLMPSLTCLKLGHGQSINYAPVVAAVNRARPELRVISPSYDYCFEDDSGIDDLGFLVE